MNKTLDGWATPNVSAPVLGTDTLITALRKIQAQLNDKIGGAVQIDATTLQGKYASDFILNTEVANTGTAYKLIRANSQGKLAASITGDADTLDGKHASDFIPAEGNKTINGDITLTGKLTLLGDPTANLHPATKQYVDNIAQGLDPKQSVKVATTGSISLSGLLNIDGVQLAAGDRVLVKSQTYASQNGIYVVASSSWTRSNDVLTPSSFVFVEQGTVNADTGWVISTDGAITIGTTDINWIQFSSAGVTVGDGVTITKNGSMLSVIQSGILDLSLAGLGAGSDTDITASNTMLQAFANLKASISSLKLGKVSVVAGKGLSTNDYTTTEKNKLAGIADGAQVNTVTSVAGKTGAVTLSLVNLVNVAGDVIILNGGTA
ncbi:MAG: hypothetical protein BGO30_01195 [Bacteroidetes bacterium 41-46]|nr:MAG: hypothetical protein BGO30_01195 [Bacteroidetes bacterium 41-46]